MPAVTTAYVTRKGVNESSHGRNFIRSPMNVDKRTATVIYENTQVTQAEIQKTIEKAGFKTEQLK
jgi:hypothetical protein